MASSKTRYPPVDMGKGKVERRGRKRKKLLNSSTEASLRNPTPVKTKPPVPVSTAKGLLNMLKEKHPILKLHALNNLNIIMDQFWPEISTNIAQIEELYEDDNFEHRHLAALVASKVFFHLGELSEALQYALGAASLFNISDGSEYVQTLVAKSVDEYISMNLRLEKGEEGVSLDPRLVAVVDRVLDRCLLDGKSEQAVGIALECRRLDKLEEAITRSRNPGSRLTYCLKLSQTFVNSREFRREVLRLLVENYQKLPEPDYLSLCQCLMLLDEPQQVAEVLQQLILGSSTLVAYQVAFDLFENENQIFLTRVKDSLQDAAAADAADSSAAIPRAAEGADNCAAAGDVEAGCSSSRGQQMNSSCMESLNKLKGILTGDIPINLYLHFLRSNNRFETFHIPTASETNPLKIKRMNQYIIESEKNPAFDLNVRDTIS